MIPSARSLAVTPSDSAPRTPISSVRGLLCGRHCVARTCSTSSAQTVESLGRSNFVNEMKIDVKEAGLARSGAHDVCIPNFFKQCAKHVLLELALELWELYVFVKLTQRQCALYRW